MGRSLLSLVTGGGQAKGSSSERPSLDLCFAPGEDALESAWSSCAPEPSDSSLDRMCAVLWECVRRPTALSINHAAADAQCHLLPRVLAYISHATDILSASADRAEISVSVRNPSAPQLVWEECSVAVAMLHAAARLFVQLASTPQYRMLLQQHELPGYVRHAISRLADCVQMFFNAHPMVAGDDDDNDALAAASQADGVTTVPPRVALLSALQGCVLLLGCMWQAGFAAVHAAEGLLLPTLPRLPDSVEERLRTPGASTSLRAEGSSGRASSATATAATAVQLGLLHVQQLLRLLELCMPLGSGASPNAANAATAANASNATNTTNVTAAVSTAATEWGAALRLQRLSAAALSVLLPALPAAESACLDQLGAQTLLQCARPMTHQQLASTSLGGEWQQRRQLLRLQLQCVAVVAQGAGAAGASPRWYEQWQAAAGTEVVIDIVRWVRMAFLHPPTADAMAAPMMLAPGAEAVGHVEVPGARSKRASRNNPAAAAAAAAGGGGSSASEGSSWLDSSSSAASRVLGELLDEAQRWADGVSAQQLTEWCQGMLPPQALAAGSPQSLALPAAMAASVDAVERAAAVASPELRDTVLFLQGCLRCVCGDHATVAPATISAPAAAAPSLPPPPRPSLAIAPVWQSAAGEADTLQIALLSALVAAFGPQPNSTLGIQRLSLEGEESSSLVDGTLWQLHVLGLIREHGHGAVMQTPLLAQRTVQLLCSACFLGRGRGPWPAGPAGVPIEVPSPAATLQSGPTTVSRLSDGCMHAASTGAGASLSTSPGLAPTDDIVAAPPGTGEPRVVGRAIELEPLSLFALHHLCALFAAPSLKPQVGAMCASVLLDQLHSQLVTLRELEASRPTTATKEETHSLTERVETIRGLCLCFDYLVAALQAVLPTPPQVLPAAPVGPAPQEWLDVLVHLSRVVAQTGHLSSRPALSGVAEGVHLERLLYSVCDSALRIPPLARWAVQQRQNTPQALFGALLGLMRECMANDKPMAADESTAAGKAATSVHSTAGHEQVSGDSSMRGAGIDLDMTEANDAPLSTNEMPSTVTMVDSLRCDATPNVAAGTRHLKEQSVAIAPHSEPTAGGGNVRHSEGVASGSRAVTAVRFALHHVLALLCHAALECRLEGELQGQLAVAEQSMAVESVSAWSLAVELFSSFVRLIASTVDGGSHALRLMALQGTTALIHQEALQLQCCAIHPHQPLSESLAQRLLRECGLFAAIGSLLDAEQAPGDMASESYAQTLSQVLAALPMLTWGSPQAQAAFLAVLSQERLAELLQRAGTPPDLPLVSRVFNWFAGTPSQMDHEQIVQRGGQLVHATAWAAPQLATVHAAEVAKLLLLLLKSCEEPLQLLLLQQIGQLLEASILNRTRCSEIRLLRRMLQLLTVELSATVKLALLRALTPLASHSVSVSELKLLFSLLAHQRTEDGASTLHLELLGTIQSMLRQHGPAASFIFDGHHSGLVLPVLPRLPPAGYSFCAWIRVDSFAPAAAACAMQADAQPHTHDTDWQPRLLSLRDDSGRGIELVFKSTGAGRRLSEAAEAAHLQLRILAASTGGNAPAGTQTLQFQYAFKASRWYHVAISHEAARLFAKVSTPRSAWAARCSSY